MGYSRRHALLCLWIGRSLAALPRSHRAALVADRGTTDGGSRNPCACRREVRPPRQLSFCPFEDLGIAAGLIHDRLARFWYGQRQLASGSFHCVGDPLQPPGPGYDPAPAGLAARRAYVVPRCAPAAAIALRVESTPIRRALPLVVVMHRASQAGVRRFTIVRCGVSHGMFFRLTRR